ncbi:MAG: glycosyltransferase [Ruminiclostridium sp.]|nr:glycosyltransferase [Ruminiclostridium sp.]
MDNVIEFDTSAISVGDCGETLYSARTCFSSLDTKKIKSDVTVLVQAYNSLDKTKRCVESILKYTKDIDFDLLLIDNGSTDDTLQYFISVDYPKKTILRFTENRGAAIPYLYIGPDMFSRYLVLVANDLIVTENWLSNMLKIAESDPKIGLVNPMSSNTSNLQDPGLKFADYDDMQKKAAAFNVSDPAKWHERLRIITLGTLYKKECLFAIGMPIADVGFAHNFADDDMAFRVRRAGYKVILAGDTWIHHDDDKSRLAPEAYKKMVSDISIGRQNFRDKYFDIDAWDDVNDYIPEYLKNLRYEPSESKRILGIDTKCGTPVLEIKNKLREYSCFDPECYAFTTDAKYYIDLQTICGNNNVTCAPIDRLAGNYSPDMFDYVVIGNDINTYNDPYGLIDSALRVLNKSGQLFISLQNTYNAFTFMNIIGRTSARNPEHSFNYSIEEFIVALKNRGYKVAYIGARRYDERVLSDEMVSEAVSFLKKLDIKDINEAAFRLASARYYLVVEK